MREVDGVILAAIGRQHGGGQVGKQLVLDWSE